MRIELAATSQQLKTSTAEPRFGLRLTAHLGWISILGFAALVPLSLLINAGNVLNYLYPAAALAVGGILYRRYPELYLGFTLWLWFLSPEVRRLVDYQQGWSPISPVQLAPYLVTALAFFTLLKHLPKLQFSRLFPFGLVFLGLFYGYIVGVFETGSGAATFDLINWLVPVGFAFYLTVHWRSYYHHRRVIQHTFVWGVLIMSLYGLLQLFILPPWDQYWILNAPIDSVGAPEPGEFRVFSTLNSQGAFAIVMMAGLLLLLSGGGLLRWSATAVGYTSFLLSFVRSAWGGWVVGLLLIAGQVRGRFSRRTLAFLVAVVGSIAVPLLTIEPVQDRVAGRLQTLANLQQDVSLNERREFYSDTLPRALLNPVGQGLGSTGVATKLTTPGGEQLGKFGNFDSGLLNIPFALGWPGSFLYVGGLSWLMFFTLRSERTKADLFAVTSRGIAVAVLIQLAFTNTLVGPSGMVFWLFLGSSLAASVYHREVTNKVQMNNGASSVSV